MKKKFRNLPNEFDPEIIKRLLKNRKALIATTQRNFFLFFYVYFGRHIRYPIAPFHFEMLRIAQAEKIKRAGVMTFRNSAKSTILNTAYALWTIMGIPKKKHVVIASQTQQRVKDHLMNIRKEIESNQLLSENLGPFSVGEDRWGATTLIIPDYEARISAISIEEGIRGLKEGPYRPDLIIADDIEDSNSVRTRESRDKTFDWFTGELIPLGETDAKVIILGNFLHPDSVLSRIGKMIKEEKMKGVFLRVPLVDEKNNIAWPGKFPSLETIEELRQSIGNEKTWQRDFLLRAIPDDYQIIDPSWIQYYDVMPGLTGEDYIGTFIGIDPAGSTNENADYTAMVTASVFGRRNKMKVYIHPNPVNKRLDFIGIKERAILLAKTAGSKYPATVVVEDTGVQKWLIQELKSAGISVEEFKVSGLDKRSRLEAIAPFIQTGKVLFPREGSKDLVQQLIGFGIERHDDLSDAMAILMPELIKESNRLVPMFFIW